MIVKTILTLLSVAFIVQIVLATTVFECKPNDGKITDGSVNISACKGPPCRLRKKHDVLVTLKFVPDEDVENVVTNVHAVIVSIPFPFIGVDGKNACNSIYEEDEKTKASCPLKKGKTYAYKTTLNILSGYPTIKVLVHWALKDVKRNKDLLCFEIPARITSQ